MLYPVYVIYHFEIMQLNIPRNWPRCKDIAHPSLCQADYVKSRNLTWVTSQQNVHRRDLLNLSALHKSLGLWAVHMVVLSSFFRSNQTEDVESSVDKMTLDRVQLSATWNPWLCLCIRRLQLTARLLLKNNVVINIEKIELSIRGYLGEFPRLNFSLPINCLSWVSENLAWVAHTI